MEPKNTIIGPLNFNKDESQSCPTKLTDDSAVKCLFCDHLYNFLIEGEYDQYLAHLYMIHRLIIADVDEIACLPTYLKHWVSRFKEAPTEMFCTKLFMDQLPDGSPASKETYFLLSEVLPEDNELRQKIKREQLDLVLARHQFERTDQNFHRECLYCRDFESTTRMTYIEHLYTKHFLQLGKADNLVFVDELIDKVQEKMEKFICLYCEKVFRDRSTLKEHMRKKGHKRINPENKNYDRFFLINYKNDKLMRNPAPMKPKNQDESVFQTDDSDSEPWSDWNGEEPPSNCLFCKESRRKVTELKEHMKSAHKIDFAHEVSPFNFYQRVKIVNYIRRQMHILRCVKCNSESDTYEDLQKHLIENGHISIGEKSNWDQPEYFFPTYEDDTFLCHLDDNVESNSDDSSVVISEKINVNVSAEAEELSLANFKL